MDFEMSTPLHAARALSVLTAVGYSSTTANRRQGAEEFIVVSVSASTEHGVTEAQRLINAVDPAARPLN